MTNQCSNIQINDEKTKWISSILKEWLEINKKYIDQYNSSDSLYWYNERANVSAFAGAVWKSGGYALEEYSAKKGVGEKEANGRVDLYFSDGIKEAIVEAKMGWLYLGKRTRLSFQEKIDRVKSKAEADITNSLLANRYPGLGISFITPYCIEKYNASEDMKDLKEFMKSYECAFYAIFENTSGKDIVSSKGNVCNSVILIGTSHN